MGGEDGLPELGSPSLLPPSPEATVVVASLHLPSPCSLQPHLSCSIGSHPFHDQQYPARLYVAWDLYANVAGSGSQAATFHLVAADSGSRTQGLRS